MKLSEVGEDRLLAKWLPTLTTNKDVVAGVGDDCAVVRSGKRREFLLLKTDCVVEGVHFQSSARASDVGWKAMARPLSDFAAMSGTPRFALITLIAPPATEVNWTTQFYRGLRRAADRHNVAIVGGETSSTSGPIAISVSVTGEVERDRCVLRSGGTPGDALFVTGRLGGSMRGRHLRFLPRIEEARWLTKHFKIHAMMDLSDGLGADLPRLARASGVGFELDEKRLPRHRGCTIEQAIGDGEDHELLFAVDAKDAKRLQEKWRKRWRLGLTEIGRLTRERSSRIAVAGYDHFAKR